MAFRLPTFLRRRRRENAGLETAQLDLLDLGRRSGPLVVRAVSPSVHSAARTRDYLRYLKSTAASPEVRAKAIADLRRRFEEGRRRRAAAARGDSSAEDAA